MSSVRVTGIEELIAKIKRLAGSDVLKPLIKAAALHIEGVIRKYPPTTIANSPDNPRGMWYQRGYGSKWHTKDGVRGSATSQQLGNQWGIDYQNGGLGAIIGNAVTYAPYVHDPEEQTSFHGAHGWKTTQTVIDDETPKVQDILGGVLQKEVDRIVGV